MSDPSPEVSDVLTELPWWAARGLVYLIAAFVAAALLWANFSTLDIVVSARGALIADGPVLRADVRVANKDIGRIEEGLPAKLKIDAYPFQEFGVVPARIAAIASTPQGDDRNGSWYRVTLAPEPAKFKMRPGLTLTAEIVTGRKTVLSLFLDPFRRSAK